MLRVSTALRLHFFNTLFDFGWLSSWSVIAQPLTLSTPSLPYLCRLLDRPHLSIVCLALTHLTTQTVNLTQPPRLSFFFGFRDSPSASFSSCSA